MPSDLIRHLQQWRKLLFGLSPTDRRWSRALRAALAPGIPALIAVGLGYSQEALLMTVGGFAVLYGERRPYRVRWRVVLTAGAGLVVAVALGGWVETIDESGVVEVALLTVVAMVGAYSVDAARLGPPGAFFFVLVTGVSMVLARSGVPLGTVLICTAIGVCSSVLVSMAGIVRDRSKPERMVVRAAVQAVEDYAQLSDSTTVEARHAAGAAIWDGWSAVYDAGLPERAPESGLVSELLAAHKRFAGVQVDDRWAAVDREVLLPRPQMPLARPTVWYRLRRSFSVHSHASAIAVRIGVAVAATGAISLALSLDRPDWAVVASVLVLHQGLDRVQGTVRGLHRFIGTVIGLGLFALIHAFSPTGYVLVLVLMVLQFLVELFVARNYGLAVIFITPLALLIIVGAHPGSPVGPVVRDRFVETLLGIAVALAALWGVLPRSHRRTFGWTEARVLRAGRRLMALDVPADHPAAMVLRRDLQFELIGCALSGSDAAHNERPWARQQWTRHAEVLQWGYDLLAQCWAELSGGGADRTELGDRLFRLQETVRS
ncbi:FUSC family protein [Skermania sp. ID1734]|uniref:FUSC family protein n=1 Tax=Skermania sp. ID1734 TaxID=2597516 RepID=UPI00117CD303|nr:FUSC family protein [Skermania sp. ID1734]TSD99425.1 FUSC family protein [Skermania sp. ID1734]